MKDINELIKRIEVVDAKYLNKEAVLKELKIIANKDKTTIEQRKEKEKEKEKEKYAIEENKKNIFETWINYRKEIKKEIKNTSTLKALCKKFNETDLQKCEWVVNNSIENNYQGLFWNNYKDIKSVKKNNIAF